MNWIPLLLADPSACLRWLVLRELFGRQTNDPELEELDILRKHDPQVAEIVEMQGDDGSWRKGVLYAAGVPAAVR